MQLSTVSSAKAAGPGWLGYVMFGALLAALFAMIPSLGFAQAAAAEAPKLDTGDTAWMLTSTALVLLMTIPGLALFYGGMVRKQNVLAIMMQSFAITCLVSILWMVIGYSLVFSEGNAIIGGFSNLFLASVAIDSVNDLAKTIPETVFVTFQMTFAIITPALITGAFADRMKFSALLWFMGLWLIFVYAPIAHMVWGGGLMGEMGVLDFAGGTVVHINAGVAGLVACLVLGKRHGYGKVAHAPHNLTLSIIGASLLWVGWFGFNAGSAVTAGPNAGMAMLVTQIATAAAAMAWMFAEWLARGKPSVLGIVCFVASTTVKNALGYDDSLDVWGVHGVGGVVGAILTGVFAKAAIAGKDAPLGLIDGNAGQVLTQIYGVVITIIFTAVVSLIILKVIDWTIGLRVDEATERDGLDLNLHGETVQ
jgi:Amt family ammonium transporter